MKPELRKDDFFYDVFLSYRHKPRDSSLCKKAHTILETFRPPRRFKNADIKRVFRDNEELPVAGVLSDTIGKALASSRVLLVVCSQHTPESQWVDREVRTFIELGRSDKIFALLIDGTYETSFPPSLKLVPGIENRTLNITGGGKGASTKRLKKELLRVIAVATETSYDNLRIAVNRRKLFKSILVGILFSMVFFISGLYSLFQWAKSSYYSLYTKREELVIQDVINDITTTLPKILETMPETSRILIKILNDNNQYIDKMMEIGGHSNDSLKVKGTNYLGLCRAYLANGDNNEALNAIKEATEIFEGLAKKSRDIEAKRDLAVCYNLSGVYMESIPQYSRAVDYYEKAVTVYKEIDQSEDTLVDIADCYNSIGRCHYYNGENLASAKAFIEEIALRKQLYGKKPSMEERKVLADLSMIVGSCLVSAGEYKEAKKYNYEAMELYNTIFEESSSIEDHRSYTMSLYTLGINMAYLKDDEYADYYLKLCLVEADQLSKKIPEFEPTYFSLYAMYDLLYADESKKEEALNASLAALNAAPKDTLVRLVYIYSLLFNNYFDSASKELDTLINEGVINPEEILIDIELFILRGRATEDLLRIKNKLTMDL